MPSNPQLHLFTKLIKLPAIKVINYHFITENELLIDVENECTEVACPHCHQKTNKVHQSHWHRVRDINISEHFVLLNINRRQFRCLKCDKVFSEELHFVKKRRTYTKRLGDKVVKEVLETNVTNASQKNRMTPAEIETLLKEIEADVLPEKPTDLKKLGIDEITHLKGGKNYAAVLVNLETSKPIALLEKRNKEVIAEYLSSLGSEVLNQIEEVSIDLWKPYKSVVEEMIENAQIVADRFHVMKQINEELNTRIKKERGLAKKLKNTADKKNKLASLKNSKYPLLKKKEALKETEKLKITEVKKIVPILGVMYEKKEIFRDIFESKITGNEALLKLLNWLKSSYKYFPKSSQTIIRWLDEILAYFDNRTTNGVVEGINQKIKLIKRNAYGLKNFDNFRRRILLHWYVS